MLTFDEWQAKHGPNGGAYDIEQQRAGWDAAMAQARAEIALLEKGHAAVLRQFGKMANSMSATITTRLEQHLYAALKRIQSYQPPYKLRRSAMRIYGVEGDEAIEMAYENVLQEASNATKGLRLAKGGT